MVVHAESAQGDRWRVSRGLAAKLAVYVVLVGFSAFMVFPFVWMVVSSLKPFEEIFNEFEDNYLPDSFSGDGLAPAGREVDEVVRAAVAQAAGFVAAGAMCSASSQAAAPMLLTAAMSASELENWACCKKRAAAKSEAKVMWSLMGGGAGVLAPPPPPQATRTAAAAGSNPH